MTQRLGSPEEWSIEENCRTCALNDVCRDKRKSREFKCTFFQAHVQKGDDPWARDFADWMRQLVKSESVLSDPYSIDDRDASLAPNFYTWCLGKKYLNAKPTPYPWQLELGIKIFGDACPWCSDTKWYKEIPFDCDPYEIRERLQLRKYGVCPKCNRSIIDGINAGLENDVANFVGVVGQRAGKCVDGNTLVDTTRGLIPIKEIVKGDRVVVRGKDHEVTYTHATRAKKLGELQTESGYRLQVSAEHLVQTPKGWKPANQADTVLIRAERSERVSIDGLHYMIEKESTSGTRLVLHPATKKCINFIQQGLLGYQIFCSVISGLIVIEQPWAYRYSKRIGIKNAHVKEHIRLGRKLGNTSISKGVCDHIADLVVMQGFSNDKNFKADLNTERGILAASMRNLFDVADLRKAQEFQSAALHGTMTRLQAAQFARVVKRMAGPDAFIRQMLIDALRDAAQSNVSWEKVKRFKHLRRDTLYDIEVPAVSRFIANGFEVHNSTGIGLLITYQQHLLLKLKNPSEFYGIKSNTILHTTVVGITYSRVKQTVWDPLMATVKDSPWFETYHQILDEVALRRGEEDIYKIKDSFVMYRPAALRWAPSSPSTRSLRGPTRIGFGVDELGHFSEDQEKINISGSEIWTVGLNSLQTVRPAFKRLRRKGIVSIPPALAWAISSPRSVGDPIMTLRKQLSTAKNSFTVMRATWDANPDQTYEELSQEYPDKVVLMRDFGCQPPFSTSPFVSSIDYMAEIVGRDHNAIRQTSVPLYGKSGKRRFITANLKFRYTDNVPKILALDAGVSFNSFAGAVAHLNEQGNLVYDLLFEIRPRTGLPVSFSAAYKRVLQPIIENMNVVAMSSDRWQNIKTDDDAEEDYGVLITKCQLQYGDFLSWREDMMSKRMEIPRPEVSVEEIIDIDNNELRAFDDMPVARLMRQSIRVVDVPGKTVDKPEDGSDDVFRAAVVAHTASRIPEVSKLLRNANLNKRAINGVGVISQGSSGVIMASQPTVGVYSGMNLRFNKQETEEPVKRPPQVTKMGRSVDGRHKVKIKVPPKKPKGWRLNSS